MGAKRQSLLPERWGSLASSCKNFVVRQEHLTTQKLFETDYCTDRQSHVHDRRKIYLLRNDCRGHVKLRQRTV